VAFVSGINIGDDNRNPLAVQLFVDYITGHIGSTTVRHPPPRAVRYSASSRTRIQICSNSNQEQAFESRISRLIIAGNCLVPPDEKADGAAVKNYQKVFLLLARSLACW
jgi:hypothetical protein